MYNFLGSQIKLTRGALKCEKRQNKLKATNKKYKDGNK